METPLQRRFELLAGSMDVRKVSVNFPCAVCEGWGQLLQLCRCCVRVTWYLGEGITLEVEAS